MCEHEHKVCKQLKWGVSTGKVTVKGKQIESHHADVDLWHCNDCGDDLYYDWHIRRFEVAKMAKFVTDGVK